MKLEPAGSTRQGSVNNRIRGRFNAWLFEALDDYMHARLGPAKTRLFAGVPGTVVEIGPGSGANLRYLPRGTHVIAIEPNMLAIALAPVLASYGLLEWLFSQSPPGAPLRDIERVAA